MFKKPVGVDLPLTLDPGLRFLPWILGMVLYVGLMMSWVAGGFFFLNWGHITPAFDPPQLTLVASVGDSERSASLSLLKEKLDESAQVRKMRILPPEAIQASLRSLGADRARELAARVQDAVLVDVWVEPGAHLPHLEETLRQHVPTFIPVLRTQGPLRGMSFFGFLGQGDVEPWVVWALVSAGVLSVLICVGVVAFGVHMAVHLQRRTLETLDLMGASSSYIARQFNKQTFNSTLQGIGICLGLGVVLFGPIVGVGLYTGWPVTMDSVGVRELAVGAGIGLGFFAVVLGLTRWITTWVVQRSLGRYAL